MHRALLVCLLAASALARQPALLRAGDALVINEMPCTACTNLLTMLQSRLDDPTSQQQLMQYVLQDVCPQLPQETRTQCSIFAPLVIASAVGWVREQSPVTVCTRVGLCPDTVRCRRSCAATVGPAQQLSLARASCAGAGPARDDCQGGVRCVARLDPSAAASRLQG